MLRLCENYILREFKKHYYIINIENGDIYKIHEIGYRAIAYLSQGYTLEEISVLISDSTSDPLRVGELLKPFWNMMVDKRILEDIVC